MKSISKQKACTIHAVPVYALLTLQWLKNLGGVAVIEKLNNAKAALLYAEIDRNPLFKGAAAIEDRSTMNATFLLNDESHAATVMWKAKEYLEYQDTVQW
jgi:phosphoserine aminotransferase